MDAEAYTALPHVTSFGGVSNLTRYYGGRRRQIEDELATIDSYTRYRRVARPKFNHVYVNFRREIIEIDLMDMSQLASRNRGVRYYLIAIDDFTKHVWFRALRKKTAGACADAMREIMHDMADSHKIRRMVMDDGNEWRGDFARLLNEKGIEKVVARRHATVVERVQRTLKGLLARHLGEWETADHVTAFPLVVHAYNNRYHRTIRMSPVAAERPENALAVREAFQLFWQEHEGRRKLKPRFAVGDLVRVQLARNTWQRSFQPTFGPEIFMVSRVFRKMPEPMYHVSPLGGGGPLRDRKYATELQKVDLRSFKIETVHWRDRRERDGRREVRVTWQGLPPAFDSFVPEASLTRYRRTAGRPWR